jgi:hypothetical protein
MKGMIYFGVGILDNDDEPFDPCGMDCQEEITAEELVKRLNKPGEHEEFKAFAPFRTVELFYKKKKSANKQRDEWKENTGKRPVMGSTKVDCILRNGDSRKAHFADNLRWTINNTDYDIIQWRKWGKS